MSGETVGARLDAGRARWIGGALASIVWGIHAADSARLGLAIDGLWMCNLGGLLLALSLLFSLPVPVGVIPIDVTIGAFFSDADRAAIGAGGRLGRVLDVLMNNFTKLLAGFMPEAEPKVRLHDPLAVATLVQPELAGFEAVRASAFGAPGRCRIVETPYGRPIDGCRSVDDRALASLMVQTLTSRAGA